MSTHAGRQLTRRAFLKAALLAPVAAAAAPLVGQAATRDYVRFKAASLGLPIRGQILFGGNLVVRSPRTCAVLTGITD